MKDTLKIALEVYFENNVDVPYGQYVATVQEMNSGFIFKVPVEYGIDIDGKGNDYFYVDILQGRCPGTYCGDYDIQEVDFMND